MNFAQFKTRLGLGVQRDDRASSYGDYVNEALREIQNRRSWTVMKKTTPTSGVGLITIGPGSGNNTVSLPSDFKELQKRSPVHYITDEGNFIPAEVVTEAEQIRRVWAFNGTPVTTWPPRVFYERNASGAVLGIIEPTTQAMNFRVKYYAYLPDLSADSDTSPFITLYPKMVIAKAKAIAFSEINDEAAAGFENEFEKKWIEAVRQDAFSEVSGRELRL